MEINIGEIILEDELNFGSLELDLVKELPELEDIEITPSGVEQNFKSSKYGYDNVKVKAVELQPNKVVAPTEQTQIITADSGYSGLNQVEVEAIPLRKDEWGGYDWIIEPSFEKDQEFFFNGEYIKQVIVPRVYEQNFKALVERTITKVDNSRIFDVGNYAFQGCENLSSVNLPSVSSIAMYAFKNCTNLSEIYLPTLTEIKPYAFEGCNALVEVNLPKLTALGGYAFYNCKAIETVILSNITSIGAYSLAGLTSCKLIQIDKCTFPATLTQYFSSTTGRIVLTFTNMIYNGCFRVSKFTEIVLPQNNVVGMATAGAFNNSSVADGTGFVYVPDDLVESYKIATNWNTFADQIKPLSQLPVLEV